MKLADEIREYVIMTRIEPARRAGLEEITVRTGDIHKEMGLVSRMPAVCGALEASKFSQQAGVQLIDRRGPKRGANVYYTFNILRSVYTGSRSSEIPMKYVEPRAIPINPRRTGGDSDELFKLDPTRINVALVSCVKTKLPTSAMAKNLYVSAMFTKARAFVEPRFEAWHILSAKYGLVDPEQIIEPYEQTLNTMSVQKRRRWARDVLSILKELYPKPSSVTFFFFAGQRYREDLAQLLVENGYAFETPLDRLSMGFQLQWYDSHMSDAI